jgi:UDP-N-acetylmuramyl tripeptide synthase
LLLVLSVCADYPDLQIGGIADEPDSVMPGDMYCCVEHITRSSVWNGHDTDIVEAALEAGAVAILAEAGTEFPDGLIPDTVPVVYADEVDELAARLAAVLHGEQGDGRKVQQPDFACARGFHNMYDPWVTLEMRPCLVYSLQM